MVLRRCAGSDPANSDLLASSGEAHYFIGNVVAGSRRVTIDFV
jgi:hypothetical protein